MSKFTFRNDSFICENCSLEVLPLRTGCRNHCPSCLHSKHVDIFPGDRQNPCQGLLKPIRYELKENFRLALIFSCLRCGEITKNLTTTEDPIQPDDLDKILSLSMVK